MATRSGPDEQSAGQRMGMSIDQVLVGPPHEGDVGEGLLIRTNRGDIPGVLHAAPESSRAVVWVCGARGGFGGPASGLYAQLAQEFTEAGITSLRMDYRYPNNIQECALDLVAGAGFLRATGYGPAVVVGHSFVSGRHRRGLVSDNIGAVVSLSPQTYGAQGAGLLSPKPLLVVHGQGRHAAPVLLRGSDSRLGQGTPGVGVVRRRGTTAWTNAAKNWPTCSDVGYRIICRKLPPLDE